MTTPLDPTPVDPTPIDDTPVSHFSKAQRQYFYGVAAAAVPVLSVFSTQVEGNAQLILALVAAVLGLGAGATAASNAVALPKP
jgi:hypothetical protein